MTVGRADILRVAGVLIATVIGGGVAPPAGAAEYWEEAVAYIEADQYPEALAELSRLIGTRPDDSFLLRLKGFTLISLDHDARAIAVLQRAVEVEPEDIAAHYFLGQAYAYSGYIGHAIERLEWLQARAPDSRYAEASAQLLTRLYKLSGNSGGGYSEKPWEFVTQLGVKYDDNVPARASNDPDTSSTSAWKYTASAYGSYDFLRLDELAHPVRAGAELSGYQSIHDDSRFEGYDLTSGNARLYSSVRGDIAELPYTLGTDLSATRAWLDSDPYSTEYSASVNLDLQIGDHFLPSLGYRYTDLEFESDTDSPELFSRDGTEHVSSMGANLYLLENRLVLGATYTYTVSDTRGSQFQINSHGINTFVHATLLRQIKVTLRGSYSEEDYEEYVPDPTRLDDVWTYGVTVARKLNDSLKLSLSFTATEAESNQDFAEYERQIVDLAVQYDFQRRR